MTPRAKEAAMIAAETLQAKNIPVTWDDVWSPGRHPEKVLLRRLTWRHLRENHPTMSLPGIAREASPGGRYDHTTILHGIRRINETSL